MHQPETHKKNESMQHQPTYAPLFVQKSVQQINSQILKNSSTFTTWSLWKEYI